MKKELLTENNVVFFSTANNSYIANAAASLLSVRNYIPKASLYILSKEISNSNKKLLAKHNIKFIELDLTYLFFQTWDYPIECYYLFAGPSVFEKLGFKYSVYLDGDTICLNNPLSTCPPISDFGGVAINSFKDVFGPDISSIKSIFKISDKTLNYQRIQSGIIYMNNAALNKRNFLEEIGNLFYKCWHNGVPRKGDDSLFALFLALHYDELHPVYLSSSYNYMPHVNSSLPNSLFFIHFTLDKPWKLRPYQHTNPSENRLNTYVRIWRQYYRQVSPKKWFVSLWLLSNLKKTSLKVSSVSKHIYFTLIGLRCPIYKKRSNLRQPPIKLYWWQPPHINNFGDTVSRDIILNLFGRQSVFSPLEECDLMAAGSILELLQQTKRNNRLYVWGSGFIRQDSSNNNLEQAIFKAVRGQKTKSRLKLNTPTGDPGILVNSTYSLFRKKHSQKIGVIIHYADMQTKIAKQFCDDHRFTVISPLDTPGNVAKKISECKLILSSSLHGLIFSDSLKIPNFHIRISNNVTGGDYKFNDYYSGIGKKYRPADIQRIFNQDYLLQLEKNYQQIPHLKQRQRSLIKSFPFY